MVGDRRGNRWTFVRCRFSKGRIDCDFFQGVAVRQKACRFSPAKSSSMVEERHLAARCRRRHRRTAQVLEAQRNKRLNHAVSQRSACSHASWLVRSNLTKALPVRLIAGQVYLLSQGKCRWLKIL